MTVGAYHRLVQGTASREQKILESTAKAIEEPARDESTMVERHERARMDPSDEPLAAKRRRMDVQFARCA